MKTTIKNTSINFKKIIFIFSLLAIQSFCYNQEIELNTLTLDSNGLYMYNDSLFDGLVYTKNTEGTIIMKGTIESGMKHGVWTYFYSTGEKKMQITYDKNKKNGKTYYWYKTGQLSKEITHNNDQIIEQKSWDVNGNEIVSPVQNN